MHLLFVCTGNICRSPFAERYAALVAAQGGVRDWSFSSAGVAALVGSGMDAQMAAELRRRGGDSTNFASRQLDWRQAADADLVLTMDGGQRSVLLEDHPRAFRRIFTLGHLAELTTQLDPALRGPELLGAVGRLRAPAGPGSDIPDPYRQDAQAAARCAQAIATAVEATIPRL